MAKSDNNTENNYQYFGKDLEAMYFANNYHRWIIAEFSPYIKGSVAEVGAGSGNISKLILETGIKNLTAFEPSENIYPLLNETLRTDKRARAINSFFGSDETGELFDSIIYVNVLEHIEDDTFELSLVHSALSQEGHLLIFVPALPWLYSDFDSRVGHFRRYTKSNLIELVRQSGFSIVKAQYFDMAGIIPWYINLTLLKSMISGTNIYLYDRLVVPVIRIIEGIVPPPIGKNLLLVARKN